MSVPTRIHGQAGLQQTSAEPVSVLRSDARTCPDAALPRSQQASRLAYSLAGLRSVLW